jgi:hypothetical protein
MWQGPEQQDTVKIPRASQVQMPVHQDRVEISQLKRTRLPDEYLPRCWAPA